jgi:putative Mg2+ transporter-C (MgtC) family protein
VPFDIFRVPDLADIVRVFVRLLVAGAFGAVIGAEREASGKAAGLRTHILVALGAALFVLFPSESGMTSADMSRVIQGVATGIGFLGAGTILKRKDGEQVHGLTTAVTQILAAVGARPHHRGQSLGDRRCRPRRRRG